ncbi:hypothetical protein ADK86_27425 [Streptomyces sp. NRRL F-5755]|uniref:hypothetical protein n=1 Tax=Streptomyces sp. NRRL F-5755 TaxID=1519475 RepID=UPI0006AFA95C|nr:hypothetical protein [Streptomyces sp. NRRL F-5755]KOT90006.1 hypothetical protein ADK86_27425 [Streptomyces sp. NRRL F-5755]
MADDDATDAAPLAAPESARPEAEEEGDSREDGVRPTAAIDDLDEHAGFGWSLVRFEAGWDRWSVLRDGPVVGQVDPQDGLPAAAPCSPGPPTTI